MSTRLLGSLAFLMLAPKLLALELPRADCSNSYEALVANHTASFHINFSKGPDGKKANGALVSDSIDWANDNQFTLGRSAFVNGLLSFGVPFPGLQLPDILIVTEGSVSALRYLFQGSQTGTYNGIPATGNKVECGNAELMTFDENALLNHLVSVNDLDSIELQVQGKIKVDQFQNVSLTPMQKTSSHFREGIKNTTAQLNVNFNKNMVAANAKLVSPDLKIHLLNGTTLTGPDAFISFLSRFQTPLPDLIAHDEYIIAQGYYSASEFIYQGTRTGVFTATDGTKVQPDGKSYRTRAMRFIRFDESGIIKEFWEVMNNNDLMTAVQN